MKVLWFLVFRTAVNGIKRALFNVRRLLGLLVTISYAAFMLWQPFRSGRGSAFLPGLKGRFELPQAEQVFGGLFCMLAVLSLILSLGIFGGKVIHRAGDVDVLFPTPISPKLVLGFNILREYVSTLLLPLLLSVFGGRYSLEGVQYMFRNAPPEFQYGMRFVVVGWILLALGWTLWAFALRIFMNRPWKRESRLRWLVGGTVLIPQLSALAYLSLRLRSDMSFASVVNVANEVPMQIAFFPATFAARMAMTALTGNWLAGGLSLLGLAAFVSSGFWAVALQVSYVYDQAATRGNDVGNIKSMQAKGDTFGILAEYARRGKVKRNRFSDAIARKTTQGAASFVWREGVLQFRGGIWQYIFLFLGASAFTVVAIAGNIGRSRGGETVFIVLQFLGVMMLSTAGSQIGFVETLKRLDVLKPLPFTPTKTVVWEVISKSIIAAVLGAFLSLLAACFNLRFWDEALTLVLVLPTFAFALCAANFLTTMLFPDQDDHTQRSLRGIVSLFASLLASFPVLITFGVVLSFRLPVLIAPLLTVPANLGLGFLACKLAGDIFADYNPSE
jgi:hypothetical protein